MRRIEGLLFVASMATLSAQTTSFSVLHTLGPETSGVGVPADIAIADFNRDGLSDIAVLGDRRLWIVPGAGNGRLAPPVLVAEFPQAVNRLVVADVDRDGWLDLVISE